MNRYLVIFGFLASFAWFGGAHAASWGPVDVNVVDADGKSQKVPYQPLEKASQPWKLCASYPHLKDAFWLAVNYGMVEEVKRQKVQLQVLDAGGYPNLNNQITQIENCVAGGANAVLIGAVSSDGLSNLLAELRKKNVPVVDFYNGVTSKDVGARALAPPYSAGLQPGRYLAQRHPAGSPAVKVALLPGPAGVGFVEAFINGFKDGIKDSSVQIVDTKYGDIGKEVQSALVEDVLQTHKDLDYIVGTAVTAEAAVPVLKAHQRDKKVKLVSLYITPGVYEGIKAKTIEAANAETAVLTARIAIDQAVRLIEKRDVQKHVVPINYFYDQSTIQQLDYGQFFAPRDFKPVFTVK